LAYSNEFGLKILLSLFKYTLLKRKANSILFTTSLQ
jgi:hypothetical protein